MTIPVIAHADSANIVRTLWHGSPLTVFERLSLLSFLKHGHVVEVYAYGDFDVPPGVTLCDANEVLPESDVFSYADGPAKGSFAAFSNLFRITLLAERGGIWADADLLCLRPLSDLPDACVGRHQEDWLNGAFLKFPAGHPVCTEIAASAIALGSDIHLGQMSGLVTEAVAGGDTDCVMLPVPALYPVSWNDTWRLVDPDERERCEALAASSHCVHWWNTAITIGLGMPKDRLPPVGSYLYEHAVDILPPSDRAAWPIETARPWIERFRQRQADDARARGRRPAPDAEAIARLMASPGATLGDWAHERLETSLQVMVYGDTTHRLLTRDANDAPLFTPQTRQDHAAVPFIPLEPAGRGRAIEIVLEGGPAADAYCPAILQDQDYNRLATVWWRGEGVTRRVVAVGPDVSQVRLVFQSQRLRPARLPGRAHIIDHRESR